MKSDPLFDNESISNNRNFPCPECGTMNNSKHDLTPSGDQCGNSDHLYSEEE